MKKIKAFNAKTGAAIAATLLTSGTAMAAIDTTAAVAEIGGSKTTVTEIGLAVLGVVAVIFAIRKAISLAGGR